MRFSFSRNLNDYYYEHHGCETLRKSNFFEKGQNGNFDQNPKNFLDLG